LRPKQLCEVCGLRDKFILQYHHMIPQCDPRCTNSDGNIAILCPNCHVLTHAGEIYFIGVYLTSDGIMPIWFTKDEEPSVAREYWIIKDNPLVKTLKGDVED